MYFCMTKGEAVNALGRALRKSRCMLRLDEGATPLSRQGRLTR